MDSNHWSWKQQIYSLPPLAAREFPHRTKWSWWTDLNPRPADYKSAALPTELHQRISFHSCIHSLISSAYIIYHILHHLSTLFSNFFKFFEAFSFFEDVLEWVSLTIISSSILFVKGFCKKNFSLYFQQNILWIFCRSVAKLQTFRFTAKLNSLLLSARTI